MGPSSYFSFWPCVHEDGDQEPEETEGKAPLTQPPRRLRKMQAAWNPEKATRRSRSMSRDLAGQNRFGNEADYALARQNFVEAEKSMAFDAKVKATATQLEKHASRVLERVRDADWDKFYGTKFRLDDGQPTGKRAEGEHFLGMVDTINETELFKIAKKMPKGAHLHIHFNTCLDAKFLIEQARDVETMYIRSITPLVAEVEDPDTKQMVTQVIQNKLDDSIISFMVLTEEEARLQNGKERWGKDCNESDELGDLFDPHYRHWYWMPYKRFQERWNEQNEKLLPGGHGIEAVENWLVTKCQISEEQAHCADQTIQGIWNQFNYRTQFMKGLFAYDTAYRNYTRACIRSFVEDNIQYAEVRPNFMKNNSVKYVRRPSDTMDNFAIMEMIQQELSITMDEIKNENNYFGGMKVIYCTPRVFGNNLIEGALNECVEMKKQYPELLCGFDLVGEEEAGNELRTFSKEFIEFQQKCAKEGFEIPFLFHCGETLQNGGKVDGNLYDAILLNAKRIGHGYGLARHPLILDIFKKRGMAIEACPISNEVLGLTNSAAGHHLHQFLAHGVPCTLNSDNGTLYRSTLSHDFYQAMVGSENMSLLGWKQLALWSLEHSCMEQDEKKEVTKVWQQKWDDFCQWIVATYDTLDYAAPVDTSQHRPGHPGTKHPPLPNK